MIPVEVETLIMFAPPAPSALVLAPLGENRTQPGTYRILPIWVAYHDALNLGHAIERHKSARPLTHDIFIDAITSLDAHISKVVIDRVEKALFSATLYLEQYGRIIYLDARPSDAVALALREDAPIYITKDVFDQASFPYLVNNPTDEEEAMAAFHEFLENVAPEDFSL